MLIPTAADCFSEIPVRKCAHERRMEGYQAFGLRQRQCWVKRINADEITLDMVQIIAQVLRLIKPELSFSGQTSRHTGLYGIAVILILDYGYLVFFFHPCTQIDLFATFGTKRTIQTGIFPFDIFAAYRTFNYRDHFQHNVSSQGISSSIGFGFTVPSCLVNRIQSMYLFADISGMAPYRASIRNLSNWYIFPCSIC